jgi:hypothetical protein
VSSEFFAHYVYCCEKIPKTVVEVQTLWQHLKDVLALVEDECQKFGIWEHSVGCVQKMKWSTVCGAF